MILKELKFEKEGIGRIDTGAGVPDKDWNNPRYRKAKLDKVGMYWFVDMSMGVISLGYPFEFCEIRLAPSEIIRLGEELVAFGKKIEIGMKTDAVENRKEVEKLIKG